MRNLNLGSLKFAALLLCGFLPLANQATDSALAQTQDKLAQGRTLWKGGKYEDAYPALREHRLAPDGKSFEVDYMIATCLCRINFRDEGRRLLNWIPTRYKLTSNNRAAVENEVKVCAPPAAAQPSKIAAMPRDIEVTTIKTSGGVSGKGGAYIPVTGGRQNSVLSYSADLIREIPLDELKSRLFDPADKDAAAAGVKKLAGNEFKVKAVGRFIMASSGSQTDAALDGIAQGLEKFIAFCLARYKMAPPAKLFTVYLVPQAYKLQSLAARIHGVRLASDTIGYSFHGDLSLAGVVADGAYGTLNHELVHLLVRANCGDIPSWLEEGLAAAYAVTTVNGDEFTAARNWREPILQKFWAERPTIGAMVKMGWDSFEAKPNDEDNPDVLKSRATVHATASYFILYLQEKQKLSAVFNAFREMDINKIEDDPGAQNIKLLESALNQTVDKINQDFDNWFNGLSKPNR